MIARIGAVAYTLFVLIIGFFIINAFLDATGFQLGSVIIALFLILGSLAVLNVVKK
ncbi:MAG: hypothetical protein V1494_01540 [Candidatus Diapherotrites archaeon]